MWAGRPIRRLLAMRLDNIGDVMMLSPAVGALRAALPGVHLSLMVSRAGAQAAPLVPGVDAVQVHRAVWQDASQAMPLDPGREKVLVEQLQAGQFDAALIFTSFSQSPYPAAYACYLAGIPMRAGQSSEFGGSVLTHWVRPLPENAHQVDRNLHLVEALGLVVADRRTKLRIPDEACHAADRLLERSGIDPQRPFLVLSPWASCPARMYPLQRFAEAAAIIGRRLRRPMVLLGAAREADQAPGFLEASEDVRAVNLVGRTTVAELCAVIARSRLVVTVNSAPMHVADALGRPVVVLYSGSDRPEQWQPRFAPHVLLGRPADCRPCYLFHCRRPRMECLELPPEEAATATVDLYRRSEAEA